MGVEQVLDRSNPDRQAVVTFGRSLGQLGQDLHCCGATPFDPRGHPLVSSEDVSWLASFQGLSLVTGASKQTPILVPTPSKIVGNYLGHAPDDRSPLNQMSRSARHERLVVRRAAESEGCSRLLFIRLEVVDDVPVTTPTSWQMIVAMDYGQFSLSGAEDEDLDWADASERALELAMSGDGIGQAGNLMTVLSPHQNNFQMSVTFELWTQAPPDDLEDWEEGFEARLDVDIDGLTYDSPTLGGESVALDPGRYGIRVCGRGFVAHGWPGSTSPGDNWRWQVWPTQQELPARRLKAWSR